MYESQCEWCLKLISNKYRPQKFCCRLCRNIGSHRGPRRLLAASFYSKVEKSKKAKDCWKWLAAKSKFGYGKIRRPGGEDDTAHRVSWELHNGPIPEGQCVLHKCDNPSCTNPKHLFLGDTQDNKDDCVAKGRHSRGEKVNTAKLTEQEVLAIREACAKGANKEKLATKYRVGRSTIFRIASRKIWKHI